MLKRNLIGLFIALLMAFTFTTQSTFAQEDDMHMPPGDMGQGMNQMQRGQMGQGMNGRRGKGRFGKHRGGQGGMMKIFKELNLTEEQKEKMKAQKETAIEQIKPLREQMMTEREKLMDLMFNPNASKEQLMAQQDKVSAIKNNMSKIRIEQMSILKEILTPEQKSKLQTLAQEKKAKMKERMAKFKEKREQFQQRRGQGQFQGPPDDDF
jgi:protein CpxP